MKKILSIFIVIIILLFSNTVKSQTAYLQDVSVNSSAIANCTTIMFGYNSSVNLSLKLKVTKSKSTDVGDFATFKLYVKKNSSSTPQLINGIIVNNSAFGSEGVSWEGTFSQTLQASDIDVSGSIFYGVYEISTSSQPKTCEYALTKSAPPSFTFYPLSLSLACGDTSSKFFMVSPANIPNNSTVTYQWSYSNWSGTVNSSMNSIYLTPSSGTFLPSTVSVTPYINGVAYPSMTCAVTRSSIASTGSISGNATVCTTGTYTFTGLLPGQSLTWSLSNTTAGTLRTTTGDSTVFTATGSGSVDLIATVTNSCGQSYAKSLSLFVGSPPAFSLVRASNETCDGIKYHYVPFEINNRNPLITYTFNIARIPGVTVTQTSWIYNGNTQNVLVFPETYAGPVDFTVSATNSCGSFSFLAEEEINSCDGLGLRLSSSVEQFTVFPNPANDIVTIELKDSENQFEKDVAISGELFDMTGQSKSKVEISAKKSDFSVKGLKKGIYILKIYMNDHVENHQIAVE